MVYYQNDIALETNMNLELKKIKLKEIEFFQNNYLVWNNLVNYAKESDMEKRNIFLTFVLATLKTAKCRDLSNRPAVPLVA